LSDREFEDMQSVIKRIHLSFFKKLSELANPLKADPKTVRVTKYRLKQKMGLGKDEDLKIFIQNIIAQ